MPKLYYAEYSPPSRACLMVAKALGVTLTLEELDMLNGAHLQPDYLKMNPTHTVPTLDDNGFTVFDSHAISMYLAEKYGKDDKLYPRDPKKRAVINQVLALDTGTLFWRLGAIVFQRPLFRGAITEIPADSRKDVQEAYGYLEAFLKQKKFLAADCLTIADVIVMATVSTLDFLVPIEEAAYPKLLKWFKKCQAEDWYSVNVKGLEFLKGVLAPKLK